MPMSVLPTMMINWPKLATLSSRNGVSFEKHISASPWGQKCTTPELELFTSDYFQMEHPVEAHLLCIRRHEGIWQNF